MDEAVEKFLVELFVEYDNFVLENAMDLFYKKDEIF